MIAFNTLTTMLTMNIFVNQKLFHGYHIIINTLKIHIALQIETQVNTETSEEHIN